MKKWARGIALVVLLIAGTYGWAWAESYQVTQRYLEQAAASLAEGDVAAALKGRERQDPRSGTVVFGGGYQQVLDLWSSPGAWPRPQGYYAAKAAADEIIAKRMTPEQGMEIFKSFYGRDNGLLPEILLSVGARLEERGDRDGAAEIYQTTMDAFPVRPDVVQQARARLEALKAK